MTAHPHDASDPSSADGPAADATPSLTADQEYLRRDPPPPRTADDIAALIQDRDAARERMYAALGDMMRTQDRCAELRAEVGALTTERDTLRQQFVDLRASTLDAMTANWQLEEENGALKAERDTLKARLALLDSPELLENLADLEHTRWSGWEAWRERAVAHDAANLARWYRQRQTAYADLSDFEKESDRIEARKGLAVIKAMMGEAADGD